MTDKIDDAIRATDGQAGGVEMTAIPVTISGTGRHVVLALEPRPLSPQERLELIAWLAMGGEAAFLEQQQRAASRLAVARSMPRGLA